jgi:uncharacterized membrane protein
MTLRSAAAVLVLTAGLTMTAAGSSFAGFKVCNKSTEKANVSVGYNHRDFGWTSEGWWTIAVDDCHTILTGDLDQRYYYIYVLGDNGGTWSAGKSGQKGGFFCLSKTKYTFHNQDYRSKDKDEVDCEAGSQQTKQFLEVDTERATDFTFTVKD